MSNRNQSRILLKGATLLIHDDNFHVVPTVSDLLIDGNIISKIEKNIDIADIDKSNTKIIDCSSKIVSPGFIDTHHHVWQTQLKGRHGNQTLVEYFPTGNFTSSFYTVQDAFYGELSGALEALDGGTTTVVDHASLNNGPDFPKTALQALASSGLRSIYCYTPPRVVPSWSPLSFHDDYTTPWVLDTFASLAAANAKTTNPRIHLGFAVDNLYMPRDALHSLFRSLRSAGAKIITHHAVGGPAAPPGAPSSLQLLAAHGLLDRDVLVSHANHPQDGDAALLRSSGAIVSTTPNTEMQMGWPPVALRPDMYDHASLGVDCHSVGTAYMPGQMRLLLQGERVARAAALAAKGKWSRKVGPTVEQVYNLATVGGARAVGLDTEVGRIAVGMRADLVVFATKTPAMLAAGQEDPVAAVVLHSSERDVETVIVDGLVRKEGGRLVDVRVEASVDRSNPCGLEGRTLTWENLAKEVLNSREELNRRMEGVDFKAAEEVILDVFHMNKEALVV